MAHMRQSRPDSSLCFQVNILKMSSFVPSSLGSASHVQFQSTCVRLLAPHGSVPGG